MNKETVLKVKKYLTDINVFNEQTFISPAQKRKDGKTFTFEEHVKGMILSLLSAQTKFWKIDQNADNIQAIFFNYDAEKIMNTSEDFFLIELEKIGCGSRTRKAQMEVLHYNIKLMKKIVSQYGSMDAFICSAPIKDIIKKLAEYDSEYKLKQMGTALVCEYLKNVGMDCAKPDVHMKRILGSNRLGYSKLKDASDDEVYEAFSKLSKETGMYIADIDYLFWLFCSDGNGAICTANPKCSQCVLKDECNMNQSLVSNGKVVLSSDIVDKASLSSDIECHSKYNKSKKDIIIEWAKEKAEQGEIEYDTVFNGGKIVRYRTKEMTQLINDNVTDIKIINVSDPWDYFNYFYEIDLQNKTILRLQLAFCYRHNPEKVKSICEEILKKYKMHSLKENEESRGNFRWVCKFDIGIKDCIAEEELKKRMDKIFYMMKGYETFICYKQDERS